MVQNASRAAALGAISFGAVLLVALATGGCTAPVSDALEVWVAGREGEVVAELIPEFEALHPDIRVRLQQIPWRGAHEKLLTAVVGESTPDVAPLGNTWIPEFAMIGALDPLDAAVNASAVIEREDYFSGAWETNRYDGQLYGIPWYVDTRLLFYRRDLLAEAGHDKPPATWAEWLAALASLQALFEKRGQRDRFPFFTPLYEYELPLALGLQQPEPLLRDDERFGNFRSPGFVRALDFYVALFRSGYVLHADNTQVGNKFDEFGAGRFAFFFGGPWQAGEIERRLSADFSSRWSTAVLPGREGPGSSLSLGSSLVVFAASKQKPAAWKLIEYLSRPAVQGRFYDLTGDLPPRRKSWDVARAAAKPQTAAFRDQLERMEPTPPVPEWERIASEVAIVSERAGFGTMSVEAAVAELDVRADRILEKRRWMLEHRPRGSGATGQVEPQGLGEKPARAPAPAHAAEPPGEAP